MVEICKVEKSIFELVSHVYESCNASLKRYRYHRLTTTGHRPADHPPGEDRGAGRLTKIFLYHRGRPPEVATQLARGDFERHRRSPSIAERGAAPGLPRRSARRPLRSEKRPGKKRWVAVRWGVYKLRTSREETDRIRSRSRHPVLRIRSSKAPTSQKTFFWLLVSSWIFSTSLSLPIRDPMKEKGDQAFSTPAGRSQHRHRFQSPMLRAQEKEVGYSQPLLVVPSNAVAFLLDSFHSVVLARPRGGVFSTPCRILGSQHRLGNIAGDRVWRYRG